MEDRSAIMQMMQKRALMPASELMPLFQSALGRAGKKGLNVRFNPTQAFGQEMHSADDIMKYLQQNPNRIFRDNPEVMNFRQQLMDIAEKGGKGGDKARFRSGDLAAQNYLASKELNPTLYTSNLAKTPAVTPPPAVAPSAAPVVGGGAGGGAPVVGGGAGGAPYVNVGPAPVPMAPPAAIPSTAGGNVPYVNVGPQPMLPSQGWGLPGWQQAAAMGATGVGGGALGFGLGKMTSASAAYDAGFILKCGQYGIDGEQLVKKALSPQLKLNYALQALKQMYTPSNKLLSNLKTTSKVGILGKEETPLVDMMRTATVNEGLPAMHRQGSNMLDVAKYLAGPYGSAGLDEAMPIISNLRRGWGYGARSRRTGTIPASPVQIR